MNEPKRKIIVRTGMWLVAVVGSIYGILLTILGYILDWGPGSEMIGPLWKVLLTGILSFLSGAYTGEIIVRKLAGIIMKKLFLPLESAVRSYGIMLVASVPAFVVSWEIGYLMGKVTGAIGHLSWITVIRDVPLMTFIWSVPISLITAALYAVFVYIYLKAGERQTV